MLGEHMVYFLNEEEKRYIFRGLLSRARADPVDVSWRGWNWDKPPLEPPYDGIRVAVYEIVVRECPTRRDVYPRHVEKIRGIPNKRMIRGALLHEVIEKIMITAKVLLFSGECHIGSELFEKLGEKKNTVIATLSDKYQKLASSAGYSEKEFSELISLRLIAYGCMKQAK